MDKLWVLFKDWHNAVFTASICFWLVYLVIYAFSGIEHDIDHDVDVDADVDHDVDHDVGDQDHDHDVDGSDSEPGVFSSMLTWLGVGRCPLSIILMTLGISWGFIGLVSNGVAKSMGFPAWLYFLPSVGIATIVGLFFTRWVSSRLAKWMPRSETSAVSVKDLVGLIGEVEVMVDEMGGRVMVYDKFGSLHNVNCRTSSGRVGQGKKVLLASYLAEEEVFIIVERPNLQN